MYRGQSFYYLLFSTYMMHTAVHMWFVNIEAKNWMRGNSLLHTHSSRVMQFSNSIMLVPIRIVIIASSLFNKHGIISYSLLFLGYINVTPSTIISCRSFFIFPDKISTTLYLLSLNKLISYSYFIYTILNLYSNSMNFLIIYISLLLWSQIIILSNLYLKPFSSKVYFIKFILRSFE